MISRWTAILSLVLVASCANTDAPQSEPKPPASEPSEPQPDEGVVALTPEQVKSAQLAIVKVEQRRATGLLSATAEIVPDPDRVAKLSPRLEGRVVAIRAGIGDHVARREALVRVDSPELGRAKADYVAAAAAAQVTREMADRQEVLAQKKISSEQDWRTAQAAAIRAQADKDAAEGRLHTMGVGDGQLASLRKAGHYSSTLTLRAPLAGTVIDRNVTLGQTVQPTDTLFTIMELSQVWMLVDVYERDLSQIHLGQKVEARLTSYGDKGFEGTVENIAAIVNPKTRTVAVRIVLPNPDGALKPGMFASVQFEGTAGLAREQLMVPATAVQRDGNKAIVFVPRGPGAYARREVRVGRTSDDWTEIETGLSEGDTVVTSGSFLLKSQLQKSSLGGDE